MNDLQVEIQKGIEGKNQGLPTGISSLDVAMFGLQKGVIIGVAGSAKSGKSTMLDSAFLINPYLEIKAKGIDAKFFYFSLELGKFDIRFRVIAHFFWRDYGIANFSLPEGVTVKGSNIIGISPSYLRSRLRDDRGNIIIISEEHQRIANEIIQNRINDMFGEYDE